LVASTGDVVGDDVGNGVDNDDDTEDVVGATVGDALNNVIGEVLEFGFALEVGTDIADGGICPIIGTEEPTSFVLPVLPEQPVTSIIETKTKKRVYIRKKDLKRDKADIIYIGFTLK